MKIIAGLGNPGRQYQKSKHNVGWMVLDKFSQKHALSIERIKFESLLAEFDYKGERVLLVKPLTFMNASGRAVRKVMDFYKLEPKDLLVIVDDIDLPLGTLRLRKSGGSGTHNGMRDLLNHLQSEAFARMRLGIGDQRQGALADYVLSAFSKADKPVLEEMLDRAVDALEDFLEGGIEYSMNRNNG